MPIGRQEDSRSKRWTGWKWKTGIIMYKGGNAMSKTEKRLEHLRKAIRAERISWGEIAELQSLAKHIKPDDVELLEWAGVKEGR